MFKEYYKIEKWDTIFIVILSIFINYLQINLFSTFLGKIVNNLQNNNIKNCYTYLFYLIIIVIFAIFIKFIYKYKTILYLIKFRNFTIDNILNKVLNGHNENLGNTNFSRLTSPIFRISYSFSRILEQIFYKFIPDITLLLTVFLFLIFKYPKLGIIFFFGNILIILYLFFSYKNMYNKSYNLENIIVKRELNVIEVFNNLEKIISKGNIDEEIKTFETNSNNILNNGRIYNFTYNLNTLILNTICYSIIIYAIFYSINLFGNKTLNIGSVVTIITIIIMYRDILIKFLDELPICLDIYAKAESVLKFVKNSLKKYDEEVNINKHKKKIYEIPSIKNIKFKNISFEYEDSNKYVFNNFNLEINVEDKIIGIIGDSGFGKSTLVKLIIKLHKYEGKILLNDTDIKNIDTNALRKKINYVNQNSKLFDKKIINNITYGLKNNDSYKFYLDEIMKFEKINKLFQNINFENTNCGFSGENLSGGQRQVINIINGLVNDSDIIILDEPTNALNYELKMEVIKMIKYFKKYKKTIIIISHDKDIHYIFDEVIDITKVKKT